MDKKIGGSIKWASLNKVLDTIEGGASSEIGRSSRSQDENKRDRYKTNEKNLLVLKNLGRD